MNAPQTLRVISFLNPREPTKQSDLSWLAIRQVRALLNAGIRVQWQILETPVTVPGTMQMPPLIELSAASIEYMAPHDARLADLPALVKLARIDGDAGVLLAVTSPEWWAPLMGDAKRRIAYLERIPRWSRHTLARLCATCDEIWVPDAQWAHAVREARAGLELVVMPPIRLHSTSSNIAQDRLQAFQALLDLAAGSFVFLCTFDSHGMQACSHLLEAWKQAFGERDDINVSLILHCPPQFFFAPAVHGGFVDVASWVDIQTEQAKHTGVVLLDQRLNVDGEDLLRACAHVLLVTSEGDGLGLRVLDAVEAGNAVVGPAMQGIEELLGPDWQSFAATELSPTAALATALLDAYEHTFDEGPRRTLIQWHVANHLSEAAFAQRVLKRLPTLQVPA